MAKEYNYSEKDIAIATALKDNGNLTIAQLNEVTGMDIKPGHVVSAMRKGLIVADGEVEVAKTIKSKVGTYNFVTSDALVGADGKAYNYTEGEGKVLAAAASIESPFTLAQLATAMGVEKLSSGSINGLVKKGNISKGEQVEIERVGTTTVKTYKFVKLPDAE